MRCRALSAALLLSGLALPGVAGAEARVRIVATDPAGESVTLGRDETFWVRVAYEVDAPTQIWVRPYLHGQEVPVRSNPSRKHTGSGEALGWFASSEQVATALDLCVLPDGDEPLGDVVGLLVQRLPDGDEQAVEEARARIAEGALPAARAKDPHAQAAIRGARALSPCSDVPSAHGDGRTLHLDHACTSAAGPTTR